jgi:hypothetical protein
VAAASPHLARLGANGRPAGSAAAAEARRYCAGVLRAGGFEVSEFIFQYSDFAGRWGAPLAGVVVAAAALGFHVGQFWPPAAFATGVFLAAALWMLGRLGSAGVLNFPLGRATGTNLQAVRGREPPRVWLVAHIDSKWQPVSMIARVLGVIGSVIGLAALIVLDVHPVGDARHAGMAAVLFTWVMALPLLLSVVGDRNAGALDNASGVAAVLEAAEQLPRDANVGILITDAEELALAGARAWCAGKPAAIAINCDSVDDRGELVVMYSGSKPRELVSRLERAASDRGERIRALRLIPGILTDHVALAESGWTTVTLSRGTIRTLQRIHTSRDTLASMTGQGIAGAARVLAATAMELV